MLFIVVLCENKGKPNPSEMWMYNFDIFVFLSSTFIFIFLSTIQVGSESLRKGLAYISNKIFIIYLLRAMVVNRISVSINVNGFIEIPLCTMITFLVCLIFACGVRLVLTNRRVVG